MQPTPHPKKPDRLLNIHLSLQPSVDKKVQTNLRDALQLLATFELIECDPEKLPDIVISDFETSFAVLQNGPLMAQIRGNLWVIMASGVKMPELMGAGNSKNTKMRRLTPIFVNASLQGQLLLLIATYDQEYNEETRVPPTAAA